MPRWQARQDTARCFKPSGSAHRGITACRANLSNLSHEVLKLISVRLFSLDTQYMGYILNFANTCLQLRRSRPPANAGDISGVYAQVKVGRILTGSGIYCFIRASVMNVSMLRTLSPAFKELVYLEIRCTLTPEAADLLKQMSLCRTLKSLKFVLGHEIVDLDCIAPYKQLTHLSLYGKGIRDISALSDNCKLVQLNMLSCPVSDLFVLSKQINLTHFNLKDCCGITDISVVKYMKALSHFSLESCGGITDISALSECNALECVDLYGSIFSTSAML
jgi:hypothetical protein